MEQGFARHASVVDPRHVVPPPGLLPAQPRRTNPYSNSDKEVGDLFGAAYELSGRTGLRPCTYAALLGLLAVIGMHSSELLRLDRDDVGLTRGVLTVQESKFGKSRYISVHESPCRALGLYASQRDRPCPHPLDPAFFLSECGARIPLDTLEETFGKLSRRVRLRRPADSYGPRLHDLRHNSESRIIPS